MLPFPAAPRFESSSSDSLSSNSSFVNPFAANSHDLISGELTTITISDYSNQSISSDTSSIAPTQSTNFYSFQSSFSPSPNHGIFEDHPGLNPNDERVVEYQCEIREKLEELNGDPETALIMAEALHGESDNIPFLESIANDLSINGVDSQSYQEALNLIAPSTLHKFEIVPLIDLHIGTLYFSFTNPSLFMLLTLVLPLVYFLIKNGGGKLVPNGWQSLVELIYDFVLNPVNEQIRRSFFQRSPKR